MNDFVNRLASEVEVGDFYMFFDDEYTEVEKIETTEDGKILMWFKQEGQKENPLLCIECDPETKLRMKPFAE